MTHIASCENKFRNPFLPLHHNQQKTIILMSDIYGIIDSWKQAKIARKERQYAIAARLYRICHILYNNGDLEAYNLDIECMGIDSLSLYKKMLRKVSLSEKDEILNECHEIFDEYSYSTLFLTDNWRTFITDQYSIIAQKYQEVENNANCEHKLRNPFVNLYRKLKNIKLWKRTTR